MLEALDFPFFQRALAVGLLASVACGIIGSYVVVKQIASISGGLSHAAFGGVGLAHLLGFQPLLGAATFAVGCGIGVGVAHRRRQQGLDTLIAMVWSIGMALGIVFVSLTPGYAPDLLSYLFGSILFVPPSYVAWTAALDVLVLLTVIPLFKEVQAVTFDEEFSEVVGTSAGRVFYLMLALTALTIVVLIRVVGVILVIALLTIPAATARQWSDRLGPMMAIAVLAGAICTMLGLCLAAILSEQFQINVPTGPLIILVASVVYCLSAVVRTIQRRMWAKTTVAT